ncbi:hypothetical protein CC78DRAFT_573181 [Lojkania enalia]|uniref:Uncharacterized protein n=1 Tax=Lojkania enalia TaxID=147567 RepID=A0A9P4ND34_9PLEO|nr:hypothetical protein CC78DRAFT_573181 [Didymosphaeria enalia]
MLPKTAYTLIPILQKPRSRYQPHSALPPPRKSTHPSATASCMLHARCPNPWLAGWLVFSPLITSISRAPQSRDLEPKDRLHGTPHGVGNPEFSRYLTGAAKPLPLGSHMANQNNSLSNVRCQGQMCRCRFLFFTAHMGRTVSPQLSSPITSSPDQTPLRTMGLPAKVGRPRNQFKAAARKRKHHTHSQNDKRLPSYPEPHPSRPNENLSMPLPNPA